MNADKLAKRIAKKVYPLGGMHRWREIAAELRAVAAEFSQTKPKPAKGR